MDIIETGSGEGWVEAERRWIAFYRASGARLTNDTDGGDGAPGRGTPEVRSAIMKKANASRTSEQRTAAGKKAKASLTPEQVADFSRVMRESRALQIEGSTHQQRSDSAKKAQANFTAEQQTAKMKRVAELRVAAMTPATMNGVLFRG